MSKKIFLGSLIVSLIFISTYPNGNVLKKMKRKERILFACNEAKSSGSSPEFAWRYSKQFVNKNYFRNRDFSNKDLSKEDLRFKNFKYANFKDCTLGKAPVEGSNFFNARGLTNEQKQYLRDNGALNVPADRTIGDNTVELRDPNLGFKAVRKMWFRCCKNIGCCKRKKRASAKLAPVKS